MSRLRFAYRPGPRFKGPPPPSLPPNAKAHWRPLIPIAISGPAGPFPTFEEAFVDLGADETLFHLDVAKAIGVRLAKGPYNLTWGGGTYPLWFAEVQLDLSDDIWLWSWRAVVAFSEAKPRYPLLGRAGFLQFINASFLGQEKGVVLEPNFSFKGRIQIKPSALASV
jgi:hypothetical protein